MTMDAGKDPKKRLMNTLKALMFGYIMLTKNVGSSLNNSSGMNLTLK